MTDLFKKLCNGTEEEEQGNSITYVSRPTGDKKPEQDIMLFVRLVQKRIGESL